MADSDLAYHGVGSLAQNPWNPDQKTEVIQAAIVDNNVFDISYAEKSDHIGLINRIIKEFNLPTNKDFDERRANNDYSDKIFEDNNISKEYPALLSLIKNFASIRTPCHPTKMRWA